MRFFVQSEKKSYILNFFTLIYVYLCKPMNNFSDKKRRIGGLLLEVLVLIFVFSSSWSQEEFTKKTKDEAILKASPVEQIAFRDSDSYIKSLLDCISKIQISGGGFTFFTIDLPALEIANTCCLYISHSLYNSFYTHLTAKAP
jgi:hypothetical protein